MKGETDSTGETAPSAEPGTGDGATVTVTDPANPVDDSGGGRKLASVAARFVSAALRVFGI